MRILTDKELSQITSYVRKITEERMDSARRNCIKKVIVDDSGCVYFQYSDRIDYIGRT